MASATHQFQDTPWIAKVPFRATQKDAESRPVQAASNIRAIGYIARPDCVQELTLCMKGPLMRLLRQIPGFRGAVILHSHRESRNVTVFTFWENEAQAIDIAWEQFPLVEKLIYPLVDVCTKVQTFQGLVSEASGSSPDRAS